MATTAAATPNPKREPLRPRSSNAPAAPPHTPARRGTPASVEKENLGLKSLGKGKEEKGKPPPAAAAAEVSTPARPTPCVAPPAPPALKPSSLQHRMKDESTEAAAAAGAPAVFVGPRGRELLPPPSSSYEAWDLSDSESAPASSWATLPNRPLPQDVGRCTCVIAREAATGARGVALYSLYTNEGQGRQDRKLAVARHRRRKGRSEFIVAQNQDGIFCTSDKNFLGTVGSNLVGSKYQIWDQGNRVDELKSNSKRLLGVVAERAGRMGYKVQTSVKNFQMTMEENGRQTVLQLGRVGKSKYIMDFRYPLTGYQAFSICLASIDSKLCCTL
nr:unnamed protein product [Digitaria exilis]